MNTPSSPERLPEWARNGEPYEQYLKAHGHQLSLRRVLLSALTIVVSTVVFGAAVLGLEWLATR